MTDSSAPDSSLIPVVFCVNADYAKAFETAIASIVQHSRRSFHFFILSKDIGKVNKEPLRAFVQRHSPASRVDWFDMQSVVHHDLESLITKRKELQHISTETYFRFYIPQIFSDYDKVLYLDADIVVYDDLGVLYDTPLGDHYAGVVEDVGILHLTLNPQAQSVTRPGMPWLTYRRQILGLEDSDRYFNAGLLLLNIQAIRSHGADTRLWEFAADNKPLDIQDQDILNAVFSHHVLFLDFKWNCTAGASALTLDLLKRFPGDPRLLTFLQSGRRPSIVHFVGPEKPWVSVFNPSDFHRQWWFFFQQTPNFAKADPWLKKASRLRTCHFINLRIGRLSLCELYSEMGVIYGTILGWRLFRKHVYR